MEEKYKKIQEAAKAGGQILKHYFGQTLEIEEKTMPADMRTKADTESEEAVLKIIKKEFPDYNIASEESDYIDNKSDYTFHIDPLDGSNNFVLGIPNFSTIIALANQGQPEIGLVYNPILDKTYHAIKGSGFFVDGQPAKVSQESDINRITISYVTGYINDKDWHADIVRKFTHAGIKRWCENWSVGMDLSLLSSGKMEAMICYHACEPHDYLAGKLMVQEAGGLVVDLEGNPEKDPTSDTFIACNNKKTLEKILKILK